MIDRVEWRELRWDLWLLATGLPIGEDVSRFLPEAPPGECAGESIRYCEIFVIPDTSEESLQSNISIFGFDNNQFQARNLMVAVKRDTAVEMFKRSAQFARKRKGEVCTEVQLLPRLTLKLLED